MINQRLNFFLFFLFWVDPPLLNASFSQERISLMLFQGFTARLSALFPLSGYMSRCRDVWVGSLLTLCKPHKSSRSSCCSTRDVIGFWLTAVKLQVVGVSARRRTSDASNYKRHPDVSSRVRLLLEGLIKQKIMTLDSVMKPWDWLIKYSKQPQRRFSLSSDWTSYLAPHVFSLLCFFVAGSVRSWCRDLRHWEPPPPPRDTWSPLSTETRTWFRKHRV